MFLQYDRAISYVFCPVQDNLCWVVADLYKKCGMMSLTALRTVVV